MNSDKVKSTALVSFVVLAFLSWSGICYAASLQESSVQQVENNDSLNAVKQSSQDCKYDSQEEIESSKGHDWFFYITNIIITSLLTLFINYLNMRFELIKLNKEPEIDRLKTIVLAGIENERKIYCDLKSVQEYLSCGKKSKALIEATKVSNFIVDNKLDIKGTLFSMANDFIAYVTNVAQGKQSRDQQLESEFFISYVKEYRK